VDPDRRRLTTTAGRTLEYDALLIAVGARGTEAVPGALTFRDTADQGAFRNALGALERGNAPRLAFAVPSGTAWPLGLYELALLSSARVREKALGGIELTLVTPEARPMHLFGRRASDLVRDLLDRAGIALRLNTTPVRFEDGHLAVRGGEAIACDQVISLPSPAVGSLPGLPQDHKGFLPVDRYGGVLGMQRVFAAGDVTQFPVKQGGLAAQQADCAAASIAALAGADIEPEPFRPVLRGALLTEWGPRYLRAPYGEATGTVARSILWWPPAKVAGRHLAPYLASRAGYRDSGDTLADLEAPYGEDAAEVRSGHADVVKLALSSADAKAHERDFGAALRWLEVAEDLELYLPRSYELKRTSWQELRVDSSR
jgi:sulfide:quinone oxidoreductase